MLKFNRPCSSIIFFALLLLILFISGCGGGGSDGNRPTERDYRQDMRDFVQDISAYAKKIAPSFAVIPQNGQELLSQNGEAAGEPSLKYIAAIDGVGREDLFYGYNEDDVSTPDKDRDYMLAFVEMAKNNGLKVLVIDYCSTHSFVDDSYDASHSRGYISFAADSRELDDIPEYPANAYRADDSDIDSLSDAKNFLYIINPGQYPDKESFISAIAETNHDIVIIDLFFDDMELTVEDVLSLKNKANGGKRLVIAYMSIGEAEDYRYYWREEWKTDPPSWLGAENPEWPGNYKVRYWEKGWKDIIYGGNSAYLDKIIAVGFDGVYLDIVDAFEYFESGAEAQDGELR